MFFLTTLNQNIYISARFLTTKIKNKLLSTLVGTVEGIEAQPFGTICIVTEVCNKLGKGKLLVGSSSALYSLTYRAVTFRAFKGEVFDSVITNVTNIGFFAEAGFLEIFVSKNQMPFNLLYQKKKKSFSDISEPESNFTKDSVVRIRILSVKNYKNPNHALGTINGEFLGLIE